MKGFHKEGRVIIASTILLVLIINSLTFYLSDGRKEITYPIGIATLVLLYLILQFFRVPKREVTRGENLVVCPADGKIVAIEEVDEKEHIDRKCIQISVFMSPLNVHINWFPVSGKVDYMQYHPGKYLVAWHPKSSTDNEMHTVVVKTERGVPILFRQIAGAMARRIKYYCNVGDRAEQSSEFGFIRFGSRVDVLVPVNSDVKVSLNQKVRGSQTVLAELNEG